MKADLERLFFGWHKDHGIECKGVSRSFSDNQMPNVDWIERSAEDPDFHRRPAAEDVSLRQASARGITSE